MSEMPEETIQETLRWLVPRKVLEYLDYRPETIQETDKAVRSFCPVHKEQVFRTYSFDSRTGKGRCSYTPCPAHKPIDLIQLTAMVKEIEYDEALAGLVHHFGLRIALPGEELPPENPLEMAREALAAGDLEKAYNGLAQVLSEEPGNVEVLCELLDLCEQLEKPDELADHQKNLAGIYFEQEENEKASEIFAKYLKIRPAEVETRLHYAECLSRLDQPDKMIEEMLQVGRIFEDREEWDKGIEIYERIDKLNPGSAQASEAIHKLLVKSGHHYVSGKGRWALHHNPG